MRYENRERMGGLCAEEKTCSRDPSWLEIARSMYHTGFNVVKRIFLARAIGLGGQGDSSPL